MRILTFDTDLLPPAERFATFRRGASDYRLEAIGDPLAYYTRWRMLALGEINAIRSTSSPLHYRRDRPMIDADGQDRVAIHYYAGGGEAGALDGEPFEIEAGSASVWDLARPIDGRSTAPSEMLILTTPRYLLDEVLACPSYACIMPPSPELALAAEQMIYLIDHAEELPDEGSPYFGRVLRDLFAVAMLPALRRSPDATDPTESPLFRRMCDLIDAEVEERIGEAAIAAALDVSVEDVRSVADRLGGLPQLVERRRLLAAYRLLCDPGEVASVSSIAWRCGFGDLSRFSPRFRETFQASPSDLRHFRHGRLPTWAGAYHVEKNYGRFIAG